MRPQLAAAVGYQPLNAPTSLWAGRNALTEVALDMIRRTRESLVGLPSHRH